MSGAAALIVTDRDDPRVKTKKAPNAFRTISEVRSEERRVGKEC